MGQGKNYDRNHTVIIMELIDGDEVYGTVSVKILLTDAFQMNFKAEISTRKAWFVNPDA